MSHERLANGRGKPRAFQAFETLWRQSKLTAECAREANRTDWREPDYRCVRRLLSQIAYACVLRTRCQAASHRTPQTYRASSTRSQSPHRNLEVAFQAVAERARHPKSARHLLNGEPITSSRGSAAEQSQR